MNPTLMLTALSQLVVLAIVVALAWRMIAAKRRREQAFDAAPDDAGAGEIPVRGTSSRGGFMAGKSRNSVNPGFAIGPVGVRIKVLRSTLLPMATIRQVDARNTLTGGTALIFQIDGRVYVARFGDTGLARQALALMPPGVPLTEAAATVRDGHARAATRGLKRYHGPI
jgi:hypothetical protein